MVEETTLFRRRFNFRCTQHRSIQRRVTRFKGLQRQPRKSGLCGLSGGSLNPIAPGDPNAGFAGRGALLMAFLWNTPTRSTGTKGEEMGQNTATHPDFSGSEIGYR